MGDFQNLYPLPLGVSKEQDKLMELYDKIYNRVSKRVYEEQLLGTGKVLSKKEDGRVRPHDSSDVRNSKIGLKNEHTKEKKAKTPIRR